MNGKLHCWIVMFALLASPVYAVDTAIPDIQADDVHALGILGQKVVVAVIDAGVDYGHPDLLGKTAPRGRTYEWGQVVGGDGAADFGDDHGTVVALEIVAPTGVAPAAKILRIPGRGPLGAEPSRQQDSQGTPNYRCLPDCSGLSKGVEGLWAARRSIREQTGRGCVQRLAAVGFLSTRLSEA